VDVLLLDVAEFSGAAHWFWRLADGNGNVLACHEVTLDPDTAEYEAFTDLYGYLHWHAAPDRPSEDSARLMAGLGRWIGMHVLGEVGTAIADRASKGPVVVRVRVPDEAGVLFARPFELAHANGRPLALHDVSLVFESAAPHSPGPGAQAAIGDRLRFLAIFSLPSDEQALGLRTERHQLERLIYRMREGGRAAIDLRVVQYGVTRARLSEVLADPEGWDVIHISGHGLPQGLKLEDAQGGQDLIGTRTLIDLLGLSRSRLKLVVLASCESAAARQKASLGQAGLLLDMLYPAALDPGPPAAAPGSSASIPPAGPPGVDAGPRRPPGGSRRKAQLPTMAAELARQTGCAVMAMRYRVTDEFSAALTEHLYRHLLGDRDPLPRALQRALTETAPGAPPLSVATPALFGLSAATLAITAPTAQAPVAGDAGKLAGIPSQPERFVGRTSLMTRASSALAPAGAVRAVAFFGMPGAGKTCCALELAYTHEHSFSKFLWYQVPREIRDFWPPLKELLAYLESHLHGTKITSEIHDAEAYSAGLRKLSETFAQREILLSLDQVDALIGDDHCWRDERWAMLIDALTAHDGPSRLVLTSRRRPPTSGRVIVEPVHPLLPLEGLLAALQVGRFRALLGTGPPMASPETVARLFVQLLMAVSGHPRLIELAGDAADRPDLDQLLDTAGQAAAESRTPLANVLRAGQIAGADDCLSAIETWTGDARGALPEPAALLLDILCALEEPDRSDSGATIAWRQVGERLHPDTEPSYAELLATLAEQGLIEILPTPDGRLRTYLMHPVVAAAGRALADPDLLVAVDEEMSLFLSAAYRQRAEIEKQQHQLVGLLRDWGERALPYLLRADVPGHASDLLMGMLSRDQSPAMAEQVLPMLRRIAAKATGTAAELEQRAKVARVESFIRPGAAETELKELLRAAEEREAFWLTIPILDDLSRISRDAGRLDESIAWLDRTMELLPRYDRSPWAGLGIEAQRLQIQFMRGESEYVLRRVRELEKTMASLPGPAPDSDPELLSVGAATSARDIILQAGMTAAGQLQRWDEMLAFSAAMDASQAERDASLFYRAVGKFGAYQALLGLGRPAEARQLVRSCLEIFTEHNDTGLRGKAIGALGTIEGVLGHHDAAVKLNEDALRLSYAQADPMTLYTQHENSAFALRRAQRDRSIALAHELAAAVIAHEAGFGSLKSNLENIARELARVPDPPSVPASFAALCDLVGAVEGVDLGRLLVRLWPDRNGETAFSEVLDAARLVLATPPDLDRHLRYWDPVIAAMHAAQHGEDRAGRWLDRVFAERAAQWPELTAALDGIRHGRSGTGSMQPVSTAVIRRAAAILADDIPVSSSADVAWRIRDYLHGRGTGGSRDAIAGRAQGIAPVLDRLEAADDIELAARARALVDLSAQLTEADLHDDAFEALERAVSAYRVLAQSDPASFTPQVATTLIQVASELLSLGLEEQAQAKADEALTICRQLAGTDPETHEPDLASCLNDTGRILARLGGPEKGLPFSQESVALYRRLARTAPTEYEPRLATALRNMSRDLAGLGRSLEALAAAHEVVLIVRPLAAADPAKHESALVLALTNVSRMLDEAGHHERSLMATQEAVDIYRRLAAGDQAVFAPLLAEALRSLELNCRKLGDKDRALAAAQEAVEVYQGLAAVSPGEFEPDLAGALNNLAVELPDEGREAEVTQALRAAADIHRRLAAGGQQESRAVEQQALVLNNLGAALAGQHHWREAVTVTAEVIPIQRRLAAASLGVFDSALAVSLSRLALVHDNLEEPTDEALAAAAESAGIYQRLSAASPEDYLAPLRRASLIHEKLLLTRSRQLLGSDRTEFHRLADESAPALDAFRSEAILGLAGYSGTRLSDEAQDYLQGRFERIAAGARIARDYLTACGQAPVEAASDDAGHAAKARRCLELHLSTCRIISICRSELRAGIPLQVPPVDSPARLTVNADMIEEAVADTERAFSELIWHLSRAIAGDDDLFNGCIISLLESLLPDDAEGWQLMSATVKLREPYKWTFTNYRIEAEAAILEFLDDVRGYAELGEQLKASQWIAVALEKMYEKTASIRAAHEDQIPASIHDDDAKTVGQAVSRIWHFDSQYRDTRSWFPPSHPLWPLHLPGQPQILQEWSLPEDSTVANLAWLPWDSGAVAVGMSNGDVLIFGERSRDLIREVSTGIFPVAFEYTRRAMMVIGPEAVTGETPFRQWLLLSESDLNLASDQVPVQDEHWGAKTSSDRRQKGKPAKLSRFSAIIREGPVPYPRTHRGFFTLGQVLNRHKEQNPQIFDYVRQRESSESELKPAEFGNSGRSLRGASEHFDLKLALDPEKSQIVIHSRLVYGLQSFPVPPGVSHFDISDRDRMLVLAGNGRLYLYG
jgi:tetratricopeptide (TPR) repeat protein